MINHTLVIRALCLFPAGMLQCCLMASNVGDIRKTPMVFLPAEYADGGAGEYGDYRIHPPYWRRIHRDSVAFVVDVPSDDSSDLVFRYTIRNPKTGDSAASEVYLSGSGPGSRVAYLSPAELGGRGVLFSPFLCDLQLFRQSPYPGPEAKLILSKRFLMDPNPESLDLEPFVAHFFPDRIGMVLRSRSCGVSGRGAPLQVRESVRTLLDWRMVANAAKAGETPAGCASDSLIHLRFRTEHRNPMESDTGTRTTFTDCREAMAADLEFKTLQPIETEEILCKDSHWVPLDSAEAANAGFTRVFLFGGNRLAASSYSSWTGGIKTNKTLVSGIGNAKEGFENGVSGNYSVVEILDVE